MGGRQKKLVFRGALCKMTYTVAPFAFESHAIKMPEHLHGFSKKILTSSLTLGSVPCSKFPESTTNFLSSTIPLEDTLYGKLQK